MTVSDEFLDRLKAAGVTQKQIGDILGIAQSNANTLYRPAKNGKRRQLKLEEAVSISKATGVPLVEGQGSHAEPPPEWPSAEQFAPIVREVMRFAPKEDSSGSGARLVAQGLVYGLELLGEPGAIRTSDDAIEVAARGAAARLRDLVRQ